MTDLLEQMMHHRGQSARSAPDIATWPDIDAGALSPSALAEYSTRLRHCLGCAACNHHPDGGIYGWRGLVRYARLRPFIRQKPIKPSVHGHGAVGALGLLLSLEPEFAQRFQRYILKTVRKDATTWAT